VVVVRVWVRGERAATPTFSTLVNTTTVTIATITNSNITVLVVVVVTAAIMSVE
jgi:hypothetical protein